MRSDGRGRAGWRSLLAVSVALSLAAVACGSDDSAGTSTDQATPDEGVAPDDTASHDDVVEEATGEPILLYSLTVVDSQVVSFGNTLDGARAAVESINANGGIAGRPLELRHCDDKLDPALAGQCATEVAENDDVVAVVSSVNTNGTVVIPILEDASIPYVSSAPVVPLDTTSLIAFPTNIGAALHGTGSAFLARELGVESVVLLASDIPSLDVREKLQRDMAAAVGVDVGKLIVIPPDTADVSPQIADLGAQDAGGVVTSVGAGDTVKVFEAMKSQQVDIPYVGAASSINSGVLEAAGDTAEGVYVSSHYPNPSADLPGLDQYRADLTKYAPDTALDDDSLRGWTGVMVFAAAAEQIQGEITRQSVIDILNSPAGIKDVLWYGDLSWAEPGPFLDEPRVVVNVAYYNQVQDGELVPFGEPLVAEPF